MKRRGDAAAARRFGVVAVAMVLGVAGCAAESAPAPRESSAAPSPPAASASGAVVPGEAPFRCDDPVGTSAAPEQGYTAVLDAVALDLGTSHEPQPSDTGPYRLFAKTGLIVRAGAPATLTVPAGTAVAWGNHAARWTRVLRFDGCPATPGAAGPWMAYPGGFSVGSPRCLPVEVRTGTLRETVRVSLGRPCA